MSAFKHGLGWIPNKKTPKKTTYQPLLETLTTTLPESVDLRHQDNSVPIYNQGSYNSCTANALAAAYAFITNSPGSATFNPSRLFIYYNQTSMEGTVGQNQGASIEDGVYVINCAGVCPESFWPYTNPLDKTPSTAAKTSGCNYPGILTNQIYNTSDINAIKTALSQNQPIVFGLAIDQNSFEKASGGYISMPGNLTGLHAVMAVGYNSDYIIFRNSWGSSWGDKGYGYLPISYINTPTSFGGLSELTSDWTVVQSLSGEIEGCPSC